MHIWLCGILVCASWLPGQHEVLAEECVELALPAEPIPQRELLFTVPYMEKAQLPADVGLKAFLVSSRIQLFLWEWNATKTSEFH